MTIEEGATSGTIVIPSIIDDQADEADETIIITLSNPTGAILGSDIVHTAIITDNDNPPEIDFNTTSSSGAESVSSAGLTVDLSAVSNQNVTVDYAITGTATGSGEDFTLGAGKLTINAGETSGTITIASIIDDPFDEPDETIIITLSNPVNATLGNDNAHTFTIIDNDTTPIINFSAPTSNGDESITSAALTLDLSVAPTQNVTLDFAVTGTATGSGTDYTLADGTLTISAGETTGTITITDIIDDLLDEENETVIVTLSNPSNATLGADNVHTYTINDNDTLPNIDFNISSSESDEPSPSISITVDLSAVSGKEVSVDYELTGTATGSGVDYNLDNGTLIIVAGENTGIITIPGIIDDDLAEEDETIIVTLSNPTNATLGEDYVYTHTILANDDDKRPILIGTDPKDDSTRVPVDSDIILTFNKIVNCESGIINIESEDNSSSFAVSLPNESVTGCGTETITINLPTDLEYETEYYVLIENTVFIDIIGNSYRGISDKKEFNFKTPIILTDPTLKQPVIDNAKAMLQIATRWIDQNVNVISKRMKTSAQQGLNRLKVNFNNNVIDSIKNMSINERDDNFVELPILELCTINSSGPKTDPSLKIKVHLSKIASEDIVLDFNITGSSSTENFSFGEGMLNIEAGLKSAIILIDGIPPERFGFATGDKKIIVTLLESSNAQLGENLVYTHTLTDDLKVWTDPNENYFCVTEFDNPKSSTSIITKSSYHSYSLVTNPQYYNQDISLADTDPDIQISNIYNEREEAESSQDLDQIESTVKDWVSDPVKVTAEGELRELLGDWTVWIDGEFGEFTLRKNKNSTRILDERSFHVGIDRLTNDGNLFGFAFGLGEAKPINRNNESHVESRNYSFSTYGKFDDRNNALQFILGISRLEFDTDRLDGKELLRGQREANQIYGSLAFIRSFSSESSNWQISPYLRFDASYTEFDKFSEIGGEAALTFDELTLSNVKASIGTDISYLFVGSKYNAMPYITLEYGLDYSETSNQNMYYNVEGPNINYVLLLDNGVKTHNWEVDLGLILEISTDMTTNLGCRWQGRSSYFSDYSSISSNDLSSSEICFLELMLSL